MLIRTKAPLRARDFQDGLFFTYRTLLCSLLTLATAFSCWAQTNVLTYHNDNARTGENLSETILTPANVNATNFGKLGFMSVDGLVDAEPLYVAGLTVNGATHNVVFVVTENDSVYAFDADSFSQLWHVSVLLSGESPSDSRSCGQVTPTIGITSTPVIDPHEGAHGTIFVVAMSKDSNGKYHQRLHALDITNGAETSGSPVSITATYTSPISGIQTTFDPAQYKERAALLLLNGVVFLSWASHCDNPPYQGWVMGYSESTLQQLKVLNLTPNGTEGAIWMSGAGLAADTTGNIYFLDANGTFDTSLDANGFPDEGDYGNSFLKLSASGNSLSVADYFAMDNTGAETSVDEDLGSGGAMVLPDVRDSSGTTWHLAVGAGKDASIYVVNRDSMGGFNSQDDNAIHQQIQGALANGVWAAPAYFNNTVYYGAVSDTLKAFSIANAKLSLSAVYASANAFAYPGTTPSISANGASNGIVWAIENSNGAGVLHAYDAGNLTELYNSNQAANGRDNFTNNKFITPMITNGKVYVGTPTGVIVLGVLTGANQIATPTISPSGGSISSTQPITIADTTAGVAIYYTTNGTTPNTTSSRYTGPFTLAASSTVEAIAVNGSVLSSVAADAFTVLAAAASPTFTPSSGTIGSSQAITLTDATAGAAIYYTIDGSTPAPGGGTTKQYSAPFTLSASATVRAIATASGFSNSATSSATFTVQSSSGSAPVSAISIDFVGLGTTPMASSEVAGVVALSNWNDASGASSSSPLALADQNGNPTTAAMTWTSDDVWDQPITDEPGNARMMKGYLDNGQMKTTIVTVSGLPANAGGYKVYVYAEGASNDTSNTGIYQISGTGISTASTTLTYNSNFNGTFTQATASNANGNYVVFTIPNVSGFTVSAIPSTASTVYQRAPINGIQIVPLSPDFTLTATPTLAGVSTGASASYTVSAAALNGFTGTVKLSVTNGMPAGATATFSSSSIAPGTSSTMTVATSGSTPAGSSTLTITGTSGSLTHTANVTLNVSSAAGSGSSSTASAISIDFVGLGTTPMTSSEVAGVVALSNWNDASGASSSSPLALADQNGNPTTAAMTWTSDDVWDQPITDEPGNARMMKGYLDNGQMKTTIVTVSGLPANAGGYKVYVYAEGASNDTSNTGIYQISGTGISTASTTLTYNSNFNGTFTQATASNANGNYVVFTIPNVSGFTVSAIPSTASTVYERAPINGIQIVPLSPDFTLTATPTLAGVSTGASASYTVSAAALNGFTGTVKLSVTNGMPAGATATFSSSSMAPGTSSTMTVATSGSTPAGSSTLTITGTSGSLTHTANVTLNVSGSAAGSGSTASAISIDFVGLGTTPMASSEVAGVVALSNWNDASGASSSSPLALADQNGNPTTAAMTWTSDDVWDQPITDEPGNARMMKGYLDNGQMKTTIVTVSGLPANAGGYKVYVYAEGASNDTSNTGIYQISGTGISTASTTLTYNSNFNGTFTQATASNANGNYVVFTIPNVSGFTVSAIPSTASTVYERAPINGIQIVP